MRFEFFRGGKFNAGDEDAHGYGHERDEHEGSYGHEWEAQESGEEEHGAN